PLGRVSRDTFFRHTSDELLYQAAIADRPHPDQTNFVVIMIS
ncbi:MAG: hypothetical protein ACI8PP_001850, partial [Candidatus Pseudothioglobus sp.]